MKTSLTTSAGLLAFVLLANSGCSKSEVPAATAEDPVPPATTAPAVVAPSAPAPVIAVTAPDIFAEMSAKLDQVTSDKHDGLSEVQSRLDRRVADRVASWKAAGHDVALATDEKLHSASEDFADKVRQLSLASSESWETAKHNTRMSLDDLRAAFVESTTIPVKH